MNPSVRAGIECADPERVAVFKNGSLGRTCVDRHMLA
jgi:hypothetical protein